MNVPELKQWLMDFYASTAFNTCKHQLPPLMTGEPLHLYMDPGKISVAVHRPAYIPIHWHDQVKDDLDRDVRIRVLESASQYTEHMVQQDGGQSKTKWEATTVDMQPKNTCSVQLTYPVEPNHPCQQDNKLQEKDG